MTASGQRIFVEAIRAWCAAHDVRCAVRSQGWLVVMERGDTRRFALGYDIGLNSAMAHRIANDKSATAEMLSFSGIDCIPHQLFLSPKLGKDVAPEGSREAMRTLLRTHPDGVVAKPNEGTSGRSVFHARTETELDHAVSEIFGSHLGLAISPYVEIAEEVRVILLDGAPLAVYRKERVADWRHNLDFGARPILLQDGAARDACVAIAIRATLAIGIRFSSVDVVRVGESWRVLEINSGVMMEALGKQHPELVHAIYAAALEKVWDVHPPLEGEGRRS
jgi:glutathione synthase/RimK-type ligase-like ATP-grasp enzyme